MFDWSGINADKSGKSQGILKSCVSGNPARPNRSIITASQWVFFDITGQAFFNRFWGNPTFPYVGNFHADYLKL